jgi:hypothetical protein
MSSVRLITYCCLALTLLVARGDATEQGLVSFDAKDRLAIINLISSYGYFGDEGLLDEWKNLFSEDAKIIGLKPNKEAATISEYMDHVTSRAKMFEERKIQRRHFLGPVRFDGQTEDFASGIIYAQLYWTQDGEPKLVATGYYVFKAAKAGSEWKIVYWEPIPDSEIN